MATLSPYYPRQIANPDFDSGIGGGWSTQVERTRGGYVQTLSEMSRKIRKWRMQWFNMAQADWQALQAFHDSVLGRGSRFYMPTLLEDTSLSSDYGGANTLAIPAGDEALFSAVDYAYGNYVLVCDPTTGNVAVQSIASTSSGTLTLDAALGAAFTAGSIVERAVMAMFTEDDLIPAILGGYLGRVSIGVDEVRVGW